MVYSSPGEMFCALSEAFGVGIVVGGVVMGSVWRWAHKRRLKSEFRHSGRGETYG